MFWMFLNHPLFLALLDRCSLLHLHEAGIQPDVSLILKCVFIIENYELKIPARTFALIIITHLLYKWDFMFPGKSFGTKTFLSNPSGKGGKKIQAALNFSVLTTTTVFPAAQAWEQAPCCYKYLTLQRESLRRQRERTRGQWCPHFSCWATGPGQRMHLVLLTPLPRPVHRHGGKSPLWGTCFLLGCSMGSITLGLFLFQSTLLSEGPVSTVYCESWREKKPIMNKKTLGVSSLWVLEKPCPSFVLMANIPCTDFRVLLWAQDAAESGIYYFRVHLWVLNNRIAIFKINLLI